MVKVWIERTDYHDLIAFHVYVNGQFVRWYQDHQLPQGNPTYFFLDTICWSGPAELVIIPTDCYGNQYLPGTWSTTINPSATSPTVSLTVDKGVDPANGQVRRKATINWNLGNGTNNWVLRADALPWTAANGTQHAGYQLWPPSGFTVTRTGSADFFFDPPAGGQQFIIKATAQSCLGTATDDVSVDCAPCDGTSSVDPVYFNDGNVRVTDGDPLPPLAGHSLSRTYNSDEQVVALFGRGWTTFLDRRLIANTDGAESVVSITTETNEVVTFRGTAGNYRQTWPHARSANATLTYNTAAAMYTYRGAGATELAVFRASDGKLTELRDLRSGRAAQISYDASARPQSVTDSWSGTVWQLSVDPVKRVVTSISVSGQPSLVWSYTYDSSGNLQSVALPAGTWRTYEYSNNRLTASYGAAGNLIESHAYDANGYGTSSTGPSDEIASIQYDIPTGAADQRITRVTEKNGHVTDYVLQPSGGSWRTVKIAGGCGSCGTRDAVLARAMRADEWFDGRRPAAISPSTRLRRALLSRSTQTIGTQRLRLHQ